ncbi:MAG: hypothetical protein JSU62_08375 [Gammaproteobacteria bacterium]|nr:MAG: hypothetical protein JSU62_08375 [Gammaproteobacteria bacterium]
MANTNEVLWWMIQQAAEHSADARLQRLFGRYEEKRIGKAYGNIWRPLFYPGTWTPVKFEDIASFPDYNQHFVYAITCDKELEQVPGIAAQNRVGFCDPRPLSPACVTHQLMGIRFLQRSECGNPDELQATVEKLQQRIHRQLTWDPRVVDVYLQRVLMLAESGDARSIKPIWVQNAMEAQRPDGGWSGIEPLLPLGAERYLAFGSRGFTIIRSPVSDFHATAQGVLLFSILVQAATDSQ